MDIEAMTGVERPRNRLLWAVVGFLLPVIVIGGGAAFFIHTTIAPILPSLSRPTLFASQDPAVVTPQPAPETASRATPQAASAPAQSMFSGLNSASIWPSMSPPQPSAPAYASAQPMFNPPGGSNDAGEPIAGPIPLPPPRPRMSPAAARGHVPLPRPRPGTEQD